MWKQPYSKKWSSIGTKLEPNLVYIDTDTMYGTLSKFMQSKIIPRLKVTRGQVETLFTQNEKFTSFEKLEVHLELNLVYWYNVETFTCSWGQRSQMKVNGHVRSIFKINLKWTILLICIHVTEDHLEPCDPRKCGIKVGCQFASSTNRDGRWHYLQNLRMQKLGNT